MVLLIVLGHDHVVNVLAFQIRLLVSEYTGDVRVDIDHFTQIFIISRDYNHTALRVLAILVLQDILSQLTITCPYFLLQLRMLV